MSYPLELSGVAGMITVGGTLGMCAAPGGLVASVEEFLEEARRLDLSGTEGRFRLGEIVEALRRQLPATADLHDRLAMDLEVDRDTITEAWFVAAAFPPATRRSGLPWTTYLILRFHPERHELVDRGTIGQVAWQRDMIATERAAETFKLLDVASGYREPGPLPRQDSGDRAAETARSTRHQGCHVA